MSWQRDALALWVVVLLCGCADVETSLQIQLVSDSRLNTVGQILSAVQTLELVLDSPSGFDGAGSAGQSHGALTARDTDGDGKLELVLRRAVDGALPQIRLLPGSNVDRSFKITARGLAGSQVTAVGGVASAAFTRGQLRDLALPFNLRASFRQPRVVFSLPHHGQVAPAALSQVYLEFSRVVMVAKDSLRLTFQGATASSVPGQWKLARHTVNELGYSETRTTATLTLPPSCSLNPGSYGIEASTRITDEAGRALDQDLGNDVADGYTAHFSIAGSTAKVPCGLSKQSCKKDADCGSGGFVCAIPTGSAEGKCVAGKTKVCTSQICPKDHVCLADKSGVQCLPDCRVYGCDPKSSCNKTSGICKPCDPTGCEPDCKALCGDICKKDPKACDDCFKKHGCKPSPGG